MAGKQPRPKEHPHGHSHEQAHMALEKEFELESMILFTDAVFAIAITLLVIDIKWPELPQGLSGAELRHLFKSTTWQFLVFVLSFIFIGQSWAIHLQLFRLLRANDQQPYSTSHFYFPRCGRLYRD